MKKVGGKQKKYVFKNIRSIHFFPRTAEVVKADEKTIDSTNKQTGKNKQN
jgi:hypothetical protein